MALKKHGEKSDSIWVNAISPKSIRISPNEIIVVEGAAVSIQCEVENAKVGYSTRWLNSLGEVLKTNVIENIHHSTAVTRIRHIFHFHFKDSSSNYHFVAYRKLNSQLLFCVLDIPDFGSINNSALITVECKPRVR